jgi:adenosylmethionine-8-amino-7-oxononanoate aminotransferase
LFPREHQSPTPSQHYSPEFLNVDKSEVILFGGWRNRDDELPQPIAVGGKGVELFDRDGKRYLDASGGAAVSCLGNGHPDVLAALHKQLDNLAYAHTGFITTEIAEQLADR